jgi:hypothetical protein
MYSLPVLESLLKEEITDRSQDLFIPALCIFCVVSFAESILKLLNYLRLVSLVLEKCLGI